jgi:hypothetical protein
MSRIAWFKIGAVGALWTIIAAAAVSGWLIGKGSAERQLSDLRQRLALSASPGQGCKLELELLEARAKAARPNLFGVTLGGLVLTPPRHLHLREMLTSR